MVEYQFELDQVLKDNVSVQIGSKSDLIISTLTIAEGFFFFLGGGLLPPQRLKKILSKEQSTRLCLSRSLSLSPLLAD